jgi:hypothetical protein
VRSPGDKGTPPVKGDPKPRDSRRPARAHAPKGLRLGGMASESEPLLNVVTTEGAKRADRLRPKGMWPGVLAGCSGTVDEAAIGEEAGPNPLLSPTRNRVSPYPCRKPGGLTVRKAERDVGRGRRRKRRPFCNGSDTGLNVTGRESEQTSADGALSRESLGTFEGRKANEREG